MKDIAIVTDSTADIPIELAEEYQIHIVPNLLIIDGQSLEDGKDITREEFYRRLPEMETFPTTATASAGKYQQVYEKLFAEGAKQILSIHASSLLSGIYNAACTAAQAFGKRIHVEDSEQVTLGLGFQVLAAAKAVLQGISLEGVLHIIHDIRRRERVIAMLDTLDYVRRSGRVSWARAQLGTLLQIKPLIELKNGRVFRLGEARTREKGIERLKHFLQSLGALEYLAILHTNAEADARKLLSELQPDQILRPLIVNVTTVIGTHVGPNGLGFAAVVQ